MLAASNEGDASAAATDGGDTVSYAMDQHSLHQHKQQQRPVACLLAAPSACYTVPAPAPAADSASTALAYNKPVLKQPAPLLHGMSLNSALSHTNSSSSNSNQQRHSLPHHSGLHRQDHSIISIQPLAAHHQQRCLAPALTEGGPPPAKTAVLPGPAGAPVEKAFSNKAYWQLAASLESDIGLQDTHAAAMAAKTAVNTIPGGAAMPAAYLAAANAILPARADDAVMAVMAQQLQSQQHHPRSPSMSLMPHPNCGSISSKKRRRSCTPGIGLMDAASPEPWDDPFEEEREALEQLRVRQHAQQGHWPPATAEQLPQLHPFGTANSFGAAAAGCSSNSSPAGQQVGSGVGSQLLDITPHFCASRAADSQAATGAAHRPAAAMAAGSRSTHAGVEDQPVLDAEAAGGKAPDGADVELFMAACLAPDVVQALAALVHADILPYRDHDGSGVLSTMMAHRDWLKG